MKKLKDNQIKFNDELFQLLNKHGINDDVFFQCLRALYPNQFVIKRIRRIPKVKEFSNLNEVNEFIKDKILRGTGVYKSIYQDGTFNYLVNYYEPD